MLAAPPLHRLSTAIHCFFYGFGAARLPKPQWRADLLVAL